MTRRLFLTTAGAATCLAADSRWMLGANTAIQGYGLYAAIELIRQLQFPVIEIHTMGTPAATPKAFPGFRFDELSVAEKVRLQFDTMVTDTKKNTKLPASSVVKPK